jgi:hypothetical protein
MADEPQLHDLTKLLLKRLESNPEEFSGTITSYYKWSDAVEAVRLNGPKSDWETLSAALHEHYMGVGLEAALKLLLNGNENENEAAKGVGQSGWAMGIQGNPTGPYNGARGEPAMSGSNINSLQNQQQFSQQTYEELLAQVRAPIQPMGVPTTTALTSFGQIKKRLGL